MKDHEGCERTYYRSTKAYWASALPNDNLNVMFGMYHPDGGSSGEMQMEWTDVGNKLTPQLKVYNDAWNVLGLFTDVIQELAKRDDEDITDDEFCAILDHLGFKDETPYESPYLENTLGFKGSKGDWWLSGNDVMCNIHTKIAKIDPVNLNNPKEHKCNGMLISKSPQMLALLQEIVQDFSAYKINAQGSSQCELILKAEKLIEEALTI